MQVGNRVFVLTPYFTNADGQLTAEIPAICPKGHNDGESCRITINHHRARKTGPCFPLTVVECHTHSLYFTLYPPGHVPYGRRPLTAHVAVNGDKITYESTDIHNPENKLVGFENSLFDAALSACRSIIWPKESLTGSMDPRFNTQLRQLDRASRLLGIHGTLDIKQTEEIVEILNLPGQVVAENLSELMHQSTVKRQGLAICQMLTALPQTLSLFERLADAGSTAALWPTPYF